MVEILLRFHVPWPLFEQIQDHSSNMAHLHLYNYKTGVPNWGCKGWSTGLTKIALQIIEMM